MKILRINESNSLLELKHPSLEGDIIQSNISSYSNEEYYVAVEQNSTKIVVILNHTTNVNNDIFKLMCILDSLNAQKIKPTLVIPLMPYARQDKRGNNDSFGLKIFASMVNHYNVRKILTCDLHNIKSASLFNCKIINVTPDILFADSIEYYNRDIVISTDQGGKERANKMANKLGLNAFYPTKHRTNDEIIHIIDFDVKDKNIIIVDDIIDGARTIKSIVNLLKKKGAKSISIVATHILFYNKITELLKSGLINKIYTSTLFDISHQNLKTVACKISSLISDKEV